MNSSTQSENVSPLVDRRPKCTDDLDVVIIGGGIAGLTAAWNLRDRRILVLEKQDRVGGRLKTLWQEPYWLNLGAHVLTPGGPMANLAAELGVELVDPPGRSLAVAMGDRLVSARSVVGLAAGLPMSLAGRMSLAQTGLKMLLARLMRPEALDAMSFADLLGKMHPEVAGLMRVVANRLSGEPGDISALLGVRGFAQLWTQRITNVAGGSAKLPQALEVRLGERIVTGADVVSVSQSEKGVEVRYGQGNEQKVATAKLAIVAVPAPLVAGLVPDLPRKQVEALGRMRYSPFVVAGIFTRESGPRPWDDLYAVAVPDRSFCMLFNPANPLRRGPVRQPGGSLVAYSVADRAEALLDAPDAVIEELYLNDLARLFPDIRSIVDQVVIQKWAYGTAKRYRGRSADVDVLAPGYGRIGFAGDHMLSVRAIDTTESGTAAAAWARTLLPGEGERKSRPNLVDR